MKKLYSKIQFAADAADDTAAVRYFLLTLLKNENEELVLLLQIQSHKSINIINTHFTEINNLSCSMLLLQLPIKYKYYYYYSFYRRASIHPHPSLSSRRA